MDGEQQTLSRTLPRLPELSDDFEHVEDTFCCSISATRTLLQASGGRAPSCIGAVSASAPSTSSPRRAGRDLVTLP